MIGVIVPAHDEAAIIEHCLRSIRRCARHPGLGGEDVQIVVVLDRCRDATADICQRWGALTVAVDHGKVGAARAAGADLLLSRDARWLANTDADSQVPANWLSAQLSCSADAFCGTVGVADWGDYPASMQVAFERQYARRDGHSHVHGANLGVSAPWYRRVGGFAPIAVDEDVHFVSALKKAGARVAHLAHPEVLTSARRDARARHGFGDYLSSLELSLRSGDVQKGSRRHGGPVDAAIRGRRQPRLGWDLA